MRYTGHVLPRLALILTLVVAFSSTALARTSGTEASTGRSFPAPPVMARAAVVMDATSGKILAGWHQHLRLPMASTTKMMTALLALKLGKLTDRIRVPAGAFNFESDATIMGLHAGQRVTLHDLLYGLLLPSGADAANTIAIHYAGSESKFVAMMNHEARALGMRDTHYEDATGLTSINHYSSAYDLAVLGRYLSQMPEIMKVVSTQSYRWHGHTLVNVNHVLFWYPGVDGIKPGFTYEAGLCQVLDAHRDGRHVIVSILNTPNLVTDARNLLNFGLRDFSWIQSALPADIPWITETGKDRRGSYTYFPGSGHYVRAAFWPAYQANGGLAFLGFPRTEPLSEGRNLVQYFQNGALSQSRATGKVTRVSLGTESVPPTWRSTPTPIRSPTPSPTPRPTSTPFESTVNPGSHGSATRTGTPTATPAGPRTTPTPAPGLTQSPAPLAARKIFLPFLRFHHLPLGTALTELHWINHYAVQLFSFGALVADAHWHTYILPVGDRVLFERGFLSAHPGNVYPPQFAPAPALRATGWLTA
ncbi:MAG: hypothetical protein ACRDFX_13560, partial [Chloroflexota bacterium]